MGNLSCIVLLFIFYQYSVNTVGNIL